MGRSTSNEHSLENAADKPTNVAENSESGGDAFQHIVDNTRIVFLYGEVSEETIAQNIFQLLHLAGLNDKPIYLVVSSYGGSVDEMFSLYDTIRFLPCPVHTVALGKIMSAGVLLLAAGVKGKRMIGKSARMMIHPVSGGAWGNVFEVINATNEHVRLQKQLVDCLLKETSMTKAQLEKMMKSGHDCFITPEEAKRLGIADIIIGG